MYTVRPCHLQDPRMRVYKFPSCPKDNTHVVLRDNLTVECNNRFDILMVK